MSHTEIYFMIQNYLLFLLLGIAVAMLLFLGATYMVTWIKDKAEKRKKKKEKNDGEN